jgi:hypothetical protein
MYDLAEDLRVAVVAAMATTDGGPPDRSFVSLGPPAWETSCSQVAVEVDGLREGATNPTSPPEATGIRFKRGRLNLVGLTAYAVRCVKASQGNSQVYKASRDVQLSAEAKLAYEDGWAIWNWINRSILDGSLFDGPCAIVHFDGGAPIEPAGGLGGWRFGLRVELGGYDPRVS